jgi:hypothetical protein
MSPSQQAWSAAERAGYPFAPGPGTQRHSTRVQMRQNVGTGGRLNRQRHYKDLPPVLVCEKCAELYDLQQGPWEGKRGDPDTRGRRLMLSGLRRIGRHLKQRRYFDAYSIAFVAFLLAALSLVPELVPDQVRWAVLLAGVGVLVLRITIPEASSATIDELLHDRIAFDNTPIADRLKTAAEVWIFAPTASNFLSAGNPELIRTRILSRPGGIVRVVVLNPANEAGVRLARRQLDESVDYPTQDVEETLRLTMKLLTVMAQWPVAGSFAFRLLDYSPGFSLVAIDPRSRDGRIIVEFHGFHNEATSSRMHIELARRQSDRWYAYWMEQFNRIWADAAEPPPT